MHCFERPTIMISLDVPSACSDEARPEDWEWRPCQIVEPVREFLYTPQELCTAMGTYGELVAQEMRPSSYSRFRLRATGLFTKLPLAAAEWMWDPMAGRYQAHGELWITWPPREIWPDELAQLVDQHALKGSSRPCKGCTLSE